MDSPADSTVLVGIAYKQSAGSAATEAAGRAGARRDDRRAYARATYVYDTRVKPPALVEIQHDSLPRGITHEAALWKDALMLADAGACRGTVNVEYLYDPTGAGAWRDMGLTRSQALDALHSSVCVIYTRTQHRRSHVLQPQGFLVGKDDDEGAYVDVICSNAGYGATLLETFIAFVRGQRRGAAITLAALPTVLTYYPRFGFAFRASCAQPPVEFDADLREQLLALVKARAFPATLEDAYTNPVTAAAMRILQQHGLNVRKEGKCIHNHASLSDIRDDFCGNDGYTMKLCPVEESDSSIAASIRPAAPPPSSHALTVFAPKSLKKPRSPTRTPIKKPKSPTRTPIKKPKSPTRTPIKKSKSPTKSKTSAKTKSPKVTVAKPKLLKPKPRKDVKSPATRAKPKGASVTSPRRSSRPSPRKRVYDV